MKRAVRAAAAAVLAGLLLGTSGCGLTAAGVDGELTDDWPPLAAPKFDLPAVGACLSTTTKTPFDPAYTVATPIECDRAHTLEVVLVGTVKGSAAQAPAPPKPGSEGFQASYTACGKAVAGYVGGEWHTGLLGIDVRQPTSQAWQGGLRDYVCSVVALSDAYGVMQMNTGSLKGSLTGAAPRALRCLAATGTTRSDGWWEDMSTLTPIDCAQPHEAEFAGTIQVGPATGSLPASDVLRKRSLGPCWDVVARFVGLSGNELDAREEFWAAWDGMGRYQWEAGDPYQRCFALFRPGKKARATVKGLGKKGFPA
ncbi:septum formation family protein [Dactylosporangium sp. NPDC006015]|uniref:septum formation family protein n=1 Tax=Dactylosporangium sp. NPDC006015 TaxID=3154576 RepID=UPI0033A46E50